VGAAQGPSDPGASPTAEGLGPVYSGAPDVEVGQVARVEGPADPALYKFYIKY